MQNGEEISRQFEWLKAYLTVNPEAAWKISHQHLKAETLERLKHAIEKLKVAREEIHGAYLCALAMKSDGDDIADKFMTSMADFVVGANVEVKSEIIDLNTSPKTRACASDKMNNQIAKSLSDVSIEARKKANSEPIYFTHL